MSIPQNRQRTRIPVSQQAAMVEVLIKMARDEMHRAGRQHQQIALAIEGATRAVETLRFVEQHQDAIRAAVKAGPLEIDGGAQ